MPNVNFWLDDNLYVKWVTFSEAKKSELKAKWRNELRMLLDKGDKHGSDNRHRDSKPNV